MKKIIMIVLVLIVVIFMSSLLIPNHAKTEKPIEQVLVENAANQEETQETVSNQPTESTSVPIQPTSASAPVAPEATSSPAASTVMEESLGDFTPLEPVEQIILEVGEGEGLAEAGG